jgi:DNA-binding NarL/FixJ family response regulator
MNQHPKGFTVDQERILDALVEFGCNKLVARHLDIPVRTLENHMSRIMARMGVRNRMHLAIEWDRWRRNAA